MLRLALPLCAAAVLFSSSCGYIGPVQPPSLHLPQRVPDLTVAERGEKLNYAFTLPRTTTDGENIRSFNSIDLAIGPIPEPFEFSRWAAASKHYEIPAPEPQKKKGQDQDDKPLRVESSLPIDGWAGKHVAIAVRASIRSDRYSQWSNVIRLEIVDALKPPIIRAESDAKGAMLTWTEQRPGLQYRIIRRSAATSQPLEVGTATAPEFIDATAQYGTEYTYTVIAKETGDHKDAESEPSAPVSIVPKDTFPPTVPGGVAALATPNSIEVSWERSPEPDTKGYYVYRSVDGQNFQRVGDMLTLPTYSDKDVQSGKKYQYEISAIDERDNESARSSPAEVTF